MGINFDHMESKVNEPKNAWLVYERNIDGGNQMRSKGMVQKNIVLFKHIYNVHGQNVSFALKMTADFL